MCECGRFEGRAVASLQRFCSYSRVLVWFVVYRGMGHSLHTTYLSRYRVPGPDMHRYKAHGVTFREYCCFSYFSATSAVNIGRCRRRRKNQTSRTETTLMRTTAQGVENEPCLSKLEVEGISNTHRRKNLQVYSLLTILHVTNRKRLFGKLCRFLGKWS